MDSPIFKQVLDLIPYAVLRKAINKYKSDKAVPNISPRIN